MMHFCPTCGIERADYEGPDAHLPKCPNCGSEAAPTGPFGAPTVQSLVCSDLKTRERIGRDGYKTALRPPCDRDSLRDAYEEALNAVCHLRQAIAERVGAYTTATVHSTPLRRFGELSDSGLLWLINRTVFHPRGFALALTVDQSGEVLGWELLGDGREPWEYASDERNRLTDVEDTFAAARRAGSRPACATT